MTTPPDNDEVDLAVDVEPSKCFVLYLVAASIFSIVIMAELISTGCPVYVWVSFLIALVVALLVMSAFAPILLSHMLGFNLSADRIYRDTFAFHQRERTLDQIVSVWRIFPFVYVHTRNWWIPFVLPSRFLLDSACREALSAFARDHLDESHPLYKLWVR